MLNFFPCGFVLGVHNKISNLVCRAELAKYPVLINILKRMHSYYRRLQKLSPTRILLRNAFLTDQKNLETNDKSWSSTLWQLQRDLKININDNKVNFDSSFKEYFQKFFSEQINRLRHIGDTKLSVCSNIYTTFNRAQYLLITTETSSICYH